MRACRREPVDVTPVWLMRQAGRYQPEFREIRSRVGFLDLCKNSELACEVTVNAVEQLGVDAAIIFADILLPLEPLGVGLEYVKGEGPLINRPITDLASVKALNGVNVESDLGYVLNSIKLTRKELRDEIPLIGFAGAPFTMASYMIEGSGSRHFEKTKALMYRQPETWALLMEKIVAVTASYLTAQAEAGADALQIFDSWVGCLSYSDYERFVLPYSKKLIDTISGKVPVIHFGTGTTAILDLVASAGGDVVGVDWRLALDKAWQVIGKEKAIQGNLDPTVLLGNRHEVRTQALRVLTEAGGRPGHIFNLGHGVLPPTDPETAKYLVSIVHEFEVPHA